MVKTELSKEQFDNFLGALNCGIIRTMELKHSIGLTSIDASLSEELKELVEFKSLVSECQHSLIQAGVKLIDIGIKRGLYSEVNHKELRYKNWIRFINEAKYWTNYTYSDISEITEDFRLSPESYPYVNDNDEFLNLSLNEGQLQQINKSLDNLSEAFKEMSGAVQQESVN
jgi:hypothetical protein